MMAVNAACGVPLTRGSMRNRSCAAGRHRGASDCGYPVVGSVGASGVRSHSLVSKRVQEEDVSALKASGGRRSRRPCDTPDERDPGNFWNRCQPSKEAAWSRPGAVKVGQPRQDTGAKSPHTTPNMSDEQWARRLQLEFDQEVQAKETRTRFKCPVCLDVARYDDSVELDCLHRLCRDCVFAYVEMKIKEKRVKEEELVCPMPSCGCEITVDQVGGLTRGTPLWDRFLETRTELWKPQDDQICACPKPGCGARFLYPAGTREVQCVYCRTQFCPRCQNQHPASTCEQFAAWQKENDAAEQSFEELLRQEGWQRCPQCKAACVRERGCMYMTCYSEQCRGNTCFCYLCGVELTRLQHYTHFPHGLFENACENVDKREEARERLARQNPQQAAGQNWWDDVVGGFQNWVFGGN